MGNSVACSGKWHRLIRWAAAFAIAPGALWAADTCDPETVYLKGDWGRAVFQVELADDPAEQALGLMHRTEMPLSGGMYFVNARPRRTSFWMRNTLIPLDMLFIDASGVVRHIHANAIPLDETAIPSNGVVLSVLEINGGLAARLGITVGTQVRHPAHADWSPVWPC